MTRYFPCSVCPLVAYLHQDGLARLATEQYTSHPDTASQHCVHLTNSAVNKVGGNIQIHQKNICPLLHYYTEQQP